MTSLSKICIINGQKIKNENLTPKTANLILRREIESIYRNEIFVIKNYECYSKRIKRKYGLDLSYMLENHNKLKITAVLIDHRSRCNSSEN
jgi:hypothetical protein